MENKRIFLERLLNQMLFFRREVLEDLLSSQLPTLELEKSFRGMYIDLYAIHETKKTPIFIEVQKNEMDLPHFNQVKKLVQQIDEGIIVWISTKTAKRYNNKLEELVSSQNKYLEIWLVEIEDSLVLQLEKLHQGNSALEIQTIRDPRFKIPKLQLKQRIVSAHEPKQSFLLRQVFQGNEKINRDLLDQLRQIYPYFGNILRAKTNLNLRQIQIGSGTGYIEIVLTAISTPKKEAKLELRSSNHTTMSKLHQIQDKLKLVKFSSRVSYKEKRFVIHYGSELLIVSVLKSPLIAV